MTVFGLGKFFCTDLFIATSQPQFLLTEVGKTMESHKLHTKQIVICLSQCYKNIKHSVDIVENNTTMTNSHGRYFI